MKTEQFGELKGRIVGEGNGPVVVLLHGYGAPATDLVGLAGVIKAPAGTRFVFPEAPLSLDMGGAMAGRAWWHVDIGRYERAMMTGNLTPLINDVPEGMAPALKKFDSFLTALQTKLQFKDEQLVLGGFSQGSMLSLDLALRSERKLAGLVLFSSTLLAAKEWVPLMKKRVGLDCLQTHGTMDPLLPYAVAELLKKELTEAKWKLDFRSFRGQHEIPRVALEGLEALLSRATSK